LVGTLIPLIWNIKEVVHNSFCLLFNEQMEFAVMYLAANLNL